MSERKYINNCPRCGFESGWTIKHWAESAEEFICRRCGVRVLVTCNAGAYAVDYGHQESGQGCIPYDMKLSDIRKLINENNQANAPAYMTFWDDTTKEVRFLTGDEETLSKIVEAAEVPFIPANM